MNDKTNESLHTPPLEVKEHLKESAEITTEDIFGTPGSKKEVTLPAREVKVEDVIRQDPYDGILALEDMIEKSLHLKFVCALLANPSMIQIGRNNTYDHSVKEIHKAATAMVDFIAEPEAKADSKNNPTTGGVLK